jgi:hypothetical protein
LVAHGITMAQLAVHNVGKYFHVTMWVRPAYAWRGVGEAGSCAMRTATCHTITAQSTELTHTHPKPECALTKSSFTTRRAPNDCRAGSLVNQSAKEKWKRDSSHHVGLLMCKSPTPCNGAQHIPLACICICMMLRTPDAQTHT